MRVYVCMQLQSYNVFSSEILLCCFPTTQKPSRVAAGVRILFWPLYCWSTAFVRGSVEPMRAPCRERSRPAGLCGFGSGGGQGGWRSIAECLLSYRDAAAIDLQVCRNREKNILISDWGDFRSGRQALERPKMNYLCISGTYNMMMFKWYMTAALNSFVWLKSWKSLSFWAPPHLLLWKCKPRGEKISSQHKFST